VFILDLGNGMKRWFV